MPAHGLFKGRFGAASLKVQQHIERINLEEVAMRFSGRRAGTAVADAAKIVLALPCAAFNSFSAGTPSGRLAGCGGTFQITQCVHVPIGASGSSAITAMDLVPAGVLLQDSAGETSAPEHVNRAGISLPFGNAAVDSTIDMKSPPNRITHSPSHHSQMYASPQT